MKGKYYTDVKLPSLRVYTGEIFTAEVETKSLLSPPQWGVFLRGGGLFLETITQMNVTMVTSWLRTITNINMVEIGRPPSSDLCPVF